MIRKIITLGITNTYLLPGDKGYILVDTGDLHREKEFKFVMKAEGVDPSEIKLIVITHAHFDHVGSLYGIKAMCNCPVLIHPHEAAILQSGKVVIPPGTNGIGKLASALGKAARPLYRFKPVNAEIKVEAEYNLKDFGLEAAVIPTPGHTPGSLSVLTADGQAIVGDLAMNFMPGANNFPIFAELPELVYPAWKLLREKGAARLFPAHGRPIPIEKIEQQLKAAGEL